MSWTPADEGGLLTWLVAEDLLSTYAPGDNVTLWNPREGTLALGANPTGPTLVAGAAPNSGPAVRFTGSASSLASGPSWPDDTASLFLFAKVTPVPGSNTNMVHHGDPGHVGFGIYVDTAGATRGLFGGVAIFGSAATPPEFAVFGMDTNTVAPTGTLYVNNVNSGTVSSAMARSSVWGFQLGLTSLMDVCELLYFDHPVDAATRGLVHNYFAAQYSAIPPLSAQAWG